MEEESLVELMAQEPKKSTENILNIVPVHQVVLFPHNVIPIPFGKEITPANVDEYLKPGRRLGIVAFREPHTQMSKDVVASDLLHSVGTEAKILKVIRFPDNTYGAVVQGRRRFHIVDFVESQPQDVFLSATISVREDTLQETENVEVLALGRALKQLVQKAIALSPNIPSEAALLIENVHDTVYLSDLIVPYLTIEFKERQELLETDDVEQRLRKIHYFLTKEVEILEISKKINTDVKTEVGKQQRKYFVREQMRALQKELGDLDDKPEGARTGNEPADLKERIEKSRMNAAAREAASRELERMSMMQAGSPEHMVSFTYLNWLLDLPWETYTQTPVHLKEAQAILDRDHYGLKKIKKRILEFLAVCALKKSLKGPIILFVGPPGVGKTSLGKSVAKALGRRFARISLGGVRDEAEIRGHRRTYIGSMPGKIVDTLKKTGSFDPVILLDEIDKLAYDGRGDPASALLEVLDPEQNHNFVDHYLNVPIDLSKVFFIATANSLHSIPAPLRDRMEVIELSSYTLEEKNHIAFDHLLPQVVEENGLKDVIDLHFETETMNQLIQGYTREPGLRMLKRELASIVRGIAREVVEKNDAEEVVGGVQKKSSSKTISKAKGTSKAKGRTSKKSLPVKLISSDDLRAYLGPRHFNEKKRPGHLPVGVSTGLAWTPVGGDVLFIETAVSDAQGPGKFNVTGQLGDVMKESVQTAMAYIRSHPKVCQVSLQAMNKKDLHMHFPEGAVKKDGPSAGVAAFLSLVSQFSKRPLSSHLAMTGEISLRGEVLPVGGIQEKLLAAHRYGIKTVMIPHENEHDLEDIPVDVRKEMRVVLIKDVQEALHIAFAPEKKKNQDKKKKVARR